LHVATGNQTSLVFEDRSQTITFHLTLPRASDNSHGRNKGHLVPGDSRRGGRELLVSRQELVGLFGVNIRRR
jgi:hypothetical protein